TIEDRLVRDRVVPVAVAVEREGVRLYLCLHQRSEVVGRTCTELTAGSTRPDETERRIYGEHLCSDGVPHGHVLGRSQRDTARRATRRLVREIRLVPELPVRDLVFRTRRICDRGSGFGRHAPAVVVRDQPGHVIGERLVCLVADGTAPLERRTRPHPV